MIFSKKFELLRNDRLGGYFPYSAEIVFRDDELGQKLRDNGDDDISWLQLLNKYEDFRQILRKLDTDDVTFSELNRHEYLQVRFSQVDNISRNVLLFDINEVGRAMLKRYPELDGYYQKFRRADWLLEAYKKYDKIFIDEPYFVLQEALMSGYVFLPEKVRQSLKGKTAFDFGGFNGAGALMLSEFLRQVCVFEPMEHYVSMVDTISKYKPNGNVKPYKLGVGKDSDIVKFYQADWKTACRMATAEDIRNHPDKIIDMQVTSIDDFVRQENITDLGLMKFDIEGVEYDAIQGGLETIKKYKPVLLISIYHNPRDFFEIIKVIDNLNLGYKFMLRSLLVDSDVPWTLLHESEYILVCWCE